MSSLRVEGLRVSYGRTEAVKGIDLSIAPGQIVCLIGANGAGKTSIMRCLSGLLHPRAGRIHFDGTDITGWRPHRIAAAGLRQVPEGRQIFAELTVAENLRIGAWLDPDAAPRRRPLEPAWQAFRLGPVRTPVGCRGLCAGHHSCRVRRLWCAGLGLAA